MATTTDTDPPYCHLSETAVDVLQLAYTDPA
jgi:hypothetical protein